MADAISVSGAVAGDPDKIMSLETGKLAGLAGGAIRRPAAPRRTGTHKPNRAPSEVSHQLPITRHTIGWSTTGSWHGEPLNDKERHVRRHNRVGAHQWHRSHTHL